MASDDHSTTSSREATREGWQGRRSTVSYSAPQYRWQGGGGSNVERQASLPRRRRRWWLLFCLLVLAGLYGCYVALLAHAPRKVPLVAAVATQYELPLPPNAWAREDLDQLAKLNEQTLRLLDTSPAWKTRSSGLAEWDLRVRELARQGSPSGVALFYVSMHGAVDERGRPCLIPPGIAPLDSQQWIPLEEFLQPLAALPAHWQKIVFLDASRLPDNWRLGIVENTFADRLTATVERSKVPGLWVLNSAGPEQTNWSSPDLSGSIFGREVAFGLAGAADLVSKSPDRKWGDGDGRVSLDELQRYVTRRAQFWSRRNRAAVQTPRLIPSDGGQFVIAKSLKYGDMDELRRDRTGRPRAKDAIATDAIAQLWSHVDALRPLQPHQGEPIAWRELEQRLLWLEQLAVAGKAYEDRAQVVHQELVSQLSRAREQAAEIADRPALAARVSVLDPRAADWPRQLPLHSLPLCEYFGAIDLKDAMKLRQQLDELASAADPQQFDARLRAALQSVPRADLFSGLVETQILRLGQQYRVPAIWNGPVPLQRLLELHLRSDQIMTGSEERSHYWARHEWRELDQRRRQADDQVFAGPEIAGTEPWQPALEFVTRATTGQESWTARFRQALATRDRALAQLPHFATLYAAGEPLGKPVAGTAADPIPSRIESAIAATSRLSRHLDAIPLQTLPEVEANEIVDLSLSISEQLDSLRGDHENYCRELLSAKKRTAATYRGLEAALRTPLLDSVLRKQVLQESQSLASQLHETATQIAQGKLKAEDIPELPRPLEGSRERLNSWPVHPLLALLDLERAKEKSSVAPAAPNAPSAGNSTKKDGKDATASSKETPASKSKAGDDETDDVAESVVTGDQLNRWEQDGGHVRQRLFELSRWTVANAAAAADAAADKVPEDEKDAATGASGASAADAEKLAREVRETRLELSRAEYSLRAAAALGAPSPDRSPVRVLRLFDLQQLLIWHSQRLLDDSWGSGRRDRPGATPEPPYFAQAVRDHLRAVELVAPPAMVVQRQLTELRAQLQRRLAAVGGALTLNIDTSEPSGSPDMVRFRVNAEWLGEAIGEAAATRAAFPSGEATVMVRQGNEILDGKRALLPLPPGATPAVKTVEAKQSNASGTGLQATMVFRGNEFSRPFFRRGLGGVLVRHEPSLMDSAQVTLFGQRRQQSSVVFILDCSSSMSREIDIEAIGGDQQPRLEVAKGVLQEFLEQIAERGDMRVGVRFFGHRAGWTRSQPVKVLTQSDYVGGIPNDLAPSDDVELVLPLGRFGPVEAGKVVRLMPGLKPWGQSPLYLALMQALGDFDADRNDTDKSIVVITDGGNYQFTPNSTNVRSRPATTMRQVQAAWRGRNVPVHIVGFGLDEDSPELAAAESEFGQITDATGGKFVPARSGQDLMRVLRARLGLGTYRVTDERGASVVKSSSDDEAPAGVRLNQPVRIAGLGTGPKKFKLDFESQSQPLVLEGGERVDFELTADGQISTRPFNANVVATLPLVSGSRRLLARVHRPISDRDGVAFRVSLQDENLEFTRRPDEVWVEVTPVMERSDGTPPTFVFYERQFEAQMPVPVIVCRTPSWPLGARSARVQVWCKFAQSTSILTRTIPQIDKMAGGEDESVPGVQGIRFRVNVVAADAQNGLTELRITEQHAAASPGIDALRVQLSAPVDLMPVRMERQSDATAGVVVHSLFIPRDRWLRLKEDTRAKLVMTTREAARDGAWRSENDRVATIEVTSASDTLPIQPAKPKPMP